MSTPASPLILTCPKCGKKYTGDPTKPTARYKCPADGSELARPGAAAPKSGLAGVSIHDKDETVRVPPPKKDAQPLSMRMTQEFSTESVPQQTPSASTPSASSAQVTHDVTPPPQQKPPAPSYDRTVEFDRSQIPPSSVQHTQQLDRSAIPPQHTQQLGRSDLPLEKTQALDRSDLGLDRTQQLDRADIPLERTQQLDRSALGLDRTHQLARSQWPIDAMQQTQRIDLSSTPLSDRTHPIDIPAGGFASAAARQADSSSEEDQATRMMGSSSSAEDESPTTMIAGDKLGTVEDQATRVIGSGGSSPASQAAAPARDKQTWMTRGSDASTMTPTVYEQRKSVLAMIQGGESATSPATLTSAKYEMAGKLGQGGVGEVLKVVDRDLKREVAMKLLLRQDSEESLIRFIEEAQATGQLEHPNIVPVHDLGVDGEGRVYFTLKYVQGVALKKVIKGRSENAVME